MDERVKRSRDLAARLCITFSAWQAEQPTDLGPPFSLTGFTDAMAQIFLPPAGGNGDTKHIEFSAWLCAAVSARLIEEEKKRSRTD